jgi:hypothetical protein
MSDHTEPNPFAVTASQQPDATRHPEATPSTRPKRVRGLATALTVMLSLAALVAVMGVVAFASRAAMLNGILDGRMPDLEDATNADAFVAVVTLLNLPVVVTSGIVFIVWQFRYVKNSRVLGSSSKLGPGWAIGGWFIPFVNLVLPAVQLSGASRASDRDGMASRGVGKAAKIVVAWIIVVDLGTLLLTWSQDAASDPADVPIERAITVDRVAAAAYVFFVAAAVLAIVMVRTLSRRQEDALAAAAGPAAYPPVTYGSSLPPMPPTMPPTGSPTMPSGPSVPPPA